MIEVFDLNAVRNRQLYVSDVDGRTRGTGTFLSQSSVAFATLVPLKLC